jgi:hypothetical protein
MRGNMTRRRELAMAKKEVEDEFDQADGRMGRWQGQYKRIIIEATTMDATTSKMKGTMGELRPLLGF